MAPVCSAFGLDIVDVTYQPGRRLLDTLYVLESYRVILLQRPPNLYLSQYEEFDSTCGPGRFSKDSLLDGVVSLFTPGSSVNRDTVSRNSLITLAVLSIYTWPAALRSANLDRRNSVWKTEFVELALNSWIQAQPKDVDFSSSVLFHMTNISLHANIKLLQCFAHTSVDSRARNPNNMIACNLRDWAASEEFDVAIWHAHALLRGAKQAIDGSLRHTTSVEVQLSTSEPPHLPYGIYFASLVLWCGSVVGKKDQAADATSVVELGIQLLSGLKVRIAELLKSALRELSA